LEPVPLADRLIAPPIWLGAIGGPSGPVVKGLVSKISSLCEIARILLRSRQPSVARGKLLKTQWSAISWRKGTGALGRRNMVQAELLERQRPQGEAGGGAGDLVGHGHVAELVDLLPRQVLQVVELADVDPLLDQQVLVAGDE
jgi:hypothetical protein